MLFMFNVESKYDNSIFGKSLNIHGTIVCSVKGLKLLKTNLS